VDGCDEVGDACTNTPSDANCDDGAFCNGSETCDAASGCQAGTDVQCEGADPFCGTGTCNETTDMCDISAQNEGLACDDADECSTGDVCVDGICTGTSSCGVPVSGGAVPVASDALFTLKASVGSEQCDGCTCDVNSDGRVSVLDALAILKKAVGQVVDLICAALPTQIAEESEATASLTGQ
jgi:hypothetical protein